MSDGEEQLEFLRWAAQVGISDAPAAPFSPRQPSTSSCLGQSLVLSQFPDAGGRGLGAARDLRRGERVLTVPKDALLTSDSVLLADEKLAASLKRRPKLSAVQILTVCLLAEVGKGERSRWHLYLTQLPRSYDTLSTFTLFEIKSLQVEDAIWASEKISGKNRSEWEEALDLMQDIGIEPRLTSFKLWLWASATVSSRALYVPWDAAGCLCPVGDLFNYAAPGDDAGEESHHRLTDGGYEEDEAAYCFYARRSYKKGEQVLLCYGTYTNLELLEHYGFLLGSNPSDKAFIPIDPSMHTTCSWPSDAFFIHRDGRPSFALLAALRLWAAPDRLRKTIGHRAYSGLQISEENEASAMKWLEKRCREVLDELPTGAAEDSFTVEVVDRLLDSDEMALPGEGEVREFLLASGLLGDSPQQMSKLKRSTGRFRLALQWRLCYKTALLQCISFCKDTLSPECN